MAHFHERFFGPIRDSYLKIYAYDKCKLWWNNKRNPSPRGDTKFPRNNDPTKQCSGPYVFAKLYLINKTVCFKVFTDGRIWCSQSIFIAIFPILVLSVCLIVVHILTNKGCIPLDFLNLGSKPSCYKLWRIWRFGPFCTHGKDTFF